MSKVVVTGAAGFIGSNLVRALLKQGREVRAVDNVSRGSKANLAGLDVEVVHADLRDYESARRAVQGGAECVYHLAARVGSIDFLHGSKRAELEALQSNLAIDANVFRACVEHRVPKVVYASSVSVYPIRRQDRLNAKFSEKDVNPIDPEGGYGWAKLLGELQLEFMEDTKSGAARIFNAYGEFNEFEEKTAQVVPALIRKAINYPKEDFVVWGDGTQTRNFLYIGDCIDALLKMEENASFPPLILNIGSPETTTVRELAELVMKTSGKDIAIKFDPDEPVGPRSRIPDVGLAKEKLGWEPKTSLEEGVRKTYQWISSRIVAVQRAH